MPTKFDIDSNKCLKKKTIGYYNQYYTGFQKPGNPDFLNVLKNTFDDVPKQDLTNARDTVTNILVDDIEFIMRVNMAKCICVCVPRAKALSTYTNSQLMFKEAIEKAIAMINKKYKLNNIDEFAIIDGTDCVVRIKDTFTTHLEKTNVRQSAGPKPYPGITTDTCNINKNKINGQNIILIDDIYTKSADIDEDCIQALYDNGAANVVFYAIGYTKPKQ